MLVKTIEYKDLDQVRQTFDNLFDEKYIFRGQSNGSSSHNENWGLISSYKRYFQNNELPFSSFIINNLDKGRFNSYFNNYSYPNSKKIASAPFIEKLYYLQHYGIPTCLIDFTKDPLIALYFAMATLKIPVVRQYSEGGYISIGSDRYITIYQIDTQLLKDVFGVKEIVDRDFCWDYEQFSLPFITQSSIKLALDLNPIERIELLDNYNLQKQKGCFILYDNTQNVNSISLETTLEHINHDHLNIEFANPVIIKHNLYLDHLRSKGNRDSIFSYLKKDKGMTGMNLFNDIQGLKFDLLQIHDNY